MTLQAANTPDEMRDIVDTTIRYSENALETIAINTIKSYDLSLINGEPRAIPIEEIIEALGLRIEYYYLRKNGLLLGEIVFDDGVTIIYDKQTGRYTAVPVQAGTIIIDGILSESGNYGRFRFTLAHELAHWLIHKKSYSGLGESAAYTETQDSVLERQADYLSSAILMPLGQVKKSFYRVSMTVKTQEAILQKVAGVFAVSKRAMRIRLESRRLI